MSAGIYFCAPPWEKFAYCAPVGDVGLWESHRDLVDSFASSSISDRTLDLDAWKNTGKEEGDEESINHRSDPDNK